MSLGLKPSRIEGAYCNHDNEIVCDAPSVCERGPACLLMRKDYLLEYLNQSKFSLVWIVQGEKQITGNTRKDLPTFDYKVGGVFYLEESGKIEGNIENFIRPYKWSR